MEKPWTGPGNGT